jgi:ribosomal protein S18 acetylase RimI-like enzyme
MVDKMKKNISVTWEMENKKVGKIDIDILNGYLAYLQHFYIDKKYRNQGIGNKLLKKTIKICDKEKIKKISCTVNYTNIPCLKIFTKNKFHQEGVLRDHFKENGTIIILSKFLK